MPPFRIGSLSLRLFYVSIPPKLSPNPAYFISIASTRDPTLWHVPNDFIQIIVPNSEVLGLKPRSSVLLIHWWWHDLKTPQAELKKVSCDTFRGDFEISVWDNLIPLSFILAAPLTIIASPLFGSLIEWKIHLVACGELDRLTAANDNRKS